MAPEESFEIKALRAEISAMRNDMAAVRESVAAIQATVEKGFEEGHRRNGFVASDIAALEQGAEQQAEHCGAFRLRCSAAISDKISGTAKEADTKIAALKEAADEKINKLQLTVTVHTVKIAIISGFCTGAGMLSVQWLFKVGFGS